MFKLTTKQLTLTGVLGALMIIMGLIGGLVPVPNLAGAMTLYHIPIIIGAIVCGPTVGFFLGIIFATIVTIQFGAVFPPYVLIPGRLLIGPFAWLAFVGIKKLFGKEENIKPAWAYTIGGLIISAILYVGYQTFIGAPEPHGANGIMFTIALAFAFGIPGILSLLKMKKISTATTVGAITGSLTNTIVTLGLGVVFPTILGETIADRLRIATGIAATNGLLELVLAVVLCVAIIPPLLARFGENGNTPA